MLPNKLILFNTVFRRAKVVKCTYATLTHVPLLITCGPLDWHQLYNLRIKAKLLRTINKYVPRSLQQSSLQRLLVRNVPNNAGNQTSICVPFYYTVLSEHGLRVCELKLSAPTQADDIVLLSTSSSIRTSKCAVRLWTLAQYIKIRYASTWNGTPLLS